MQQDTKQQLAEWLKDFVAARQRPLHERWDYSFIHTYKPVLDDAPYRVFNSLKDYRIWCEKFLPKWLGYGKDI